MESYSNLSLKILLVGILERRKIWIRCVHLCKTEFQKPNSEHVFTNCCLSFVSEMQSFYFSRFDSKTLLQRYNPEPGKGGEYLHKAANLFSGFVATNRDRYLSVAVKFVSSENGSYIVKVIQRAGKTIDP